MASDSTYKPLFEDRKAVHDKVACAGGNLLSCECWYSWGWIMAFYRPTIDRSIWVNFMDSVTQSSGYFWQGYDDGEYAREELQASL